MELEVDKTRRLPGAGRFNTGPRVERGEADGTVRGHQVAPAELAELEHFQLLLGFLHHILAHILEVLEVLVFIMFSLVLCI